MQWTKKKYKSNDVKIVLNMLAGILLCLACLPGALSQGIPVDSLTLTQLFSTRQDSSISCYRIPALITTSNGRLLAAIDERIPSCADLRGNEDINIVIRFSDDDGATWSAIQRIVDYPFGESASDPSMILDEGTGEIFLFYNYMDLHTASGIYRLRYIASSDDGSTWSESKDITEQISKNHWEKDFKFITSGKGTQLRAGTMLHTLVNLENGLHVFGSKDHGQSWFLIDTAIQPADESRIIELNDGRWMINSRVSQLGQRFVHISGDQGESWQSRPSTYLPDPACNASLIRYRHADIQEGPLLFTNPNAENARENLCLKASFDEGQSWELIQVIYPGKAAYSSISILQNGDIGVFFEKDDYQDNVFVRIPAMVLNKLKDPANER